MSKPATKSAFGIPLERDEDGGLYGGLVTGESVSFWLYDDMWRGQLRCGGIIISETIGNSSVASCYRSLRGRCKNAARALERSLNRKQAARKGK